MKIKKYFLATLIGIVPGIFIINSIGAGIGSFINQNDSIIWTELIKDPKIYFPILVFIILIILAATINKFLFNNKFSK